MRSNRTVSRQSDEPRVIAVAATQTRISDALILAGGFATFLCAWAMMWSGWF